MLSPEQIAARKGRLTASRVACLMRGDPAAILRLYQEFIGEAQEEDLSHVWPVRLGEATEQLQIYWYAMKAGGAVSRMGEVVVHQKHEWAAATLDAWDDVLGCPIEAKHCGGREPLEIIIDRYSPQLHWQMEVTGSSQAALSVIMGANEPVIEYIEKDEEYCREMLNRGAQFMEFVRRREPPVVLPPVASPINATKTYDLSTNNSWASEAFTWLENKASADRCKDAEKILKSIVPADAKKCHGAGVQITRDRAGRLSLREAT